MKYAFLVALREYTEHVKTKGFWIGILMLPVMLALSFKVPQLLDDVARPTRTFAVVDPSGEWTAVVDAAVAAHYDKKNGEALLKYMGSHKNGDGSTDTFEPLRPFFVRAPLPPDVDGKDPAAAVEAARPYLNGSRKLSVEGAERTLFALVVFPSDPGRVRKDVEYWCSNLADNDLKDLIADGLSKHLQRDEFAKQGLDAKEIDRIDRLRVTLSGKDPKKEAGKEGVSQAERMRQLAPLAFVYLLFVGIMTVAQMLLASTIEEKSNRIVEVLLSSVTPWELMLGKLLGVAASGLTMLAAWILSCIGIFLWLSSSGSEVAGQLFHMVFGPGMLVPFAIYFVLGFLMYASLLLALGSTCNTLKDAQNFMGPIMIVLVLPLLSMMFIVNDPNGTLAVVMSWIPVFTPFVMMNRIAGSPPMSDIVGTTILLIATIAFVIWISGRIFRAGILRTGQPPKLLELLRLARG